MIELLSLHITSSDIQEFEETVEFYQGLLGEAPAERTPSNDEQVSAVFSVAAQKFVITFAPKIIHEANIAQRRIWLCFRSETPHAVLQQARDRGVFLPNDVVDGQWGGRGFFATDPSGIGVYLGTGVVSLR